MLGNVVARAREVDVASRRRLEQIAARIRSELRVSLVGDESAGEHQVRVVVGHEDLSLGVELAQPLAMAGGPHAGRQERDVVRRPERFVAPDTSKIFWRKWQPRL